MRGLAHTVRAVIFPMAVGAIALAAIGLGIPSTVQAEDEMKIEVTITDKGYDVTGHTTTGSLTKIIVRNQGSMTHGVTSPMFKEGVLNKEGDGTEIRGPKGKGIMAYHLDAGKTMTLTFKKESRPDPENGGGQQRRLVTRRRLLGAETVHTNDTYRQCGHRFSGLCR